MRLNKFRKDPDDRKRYVVDYTDWLNATEKLSTVDLGGNNVPEENFYVDGYTIAGDGLSVIFFVSGGVNGKEYDVEITVTTSFSQMKNDHITFVVTD